MQNDNTLREQILKLLKGGQAYSPFDDIIKDFPEEHINDIFPSGEYSFWHLLEHIRRTQYDILDFMINPHYVEPEWPKDYWPDYKKKATKKDWDTTIEKIKKDMTKIQKILMDPNTYLYAKVPAGSGQIYLREFLVIADHNSYHLGEFSIMRQVLKSWGKSHNG